MSNSELHDIAANFGGSATTYDSVATVQARLAKQLAAMVAPHIARGAHIVDIGCGTGFLSDALATLCHPDRITLFDLSDAMIAEATRKLKAHPDIEVAHHTGDAESLPWPSATAITSASAVQWFKDPLSFAAKARAAIQPGGVVALATYGPSTFAELRNGQPCSYPTLANWLEAMSAAGIDIVESRHKTEVQSFDSRTAMLRMMALSGIGTRRRGQSTASMGGDWRLTWETIVMVGKLRATE